jgi:membrane-associated phospholipid phosphatase
MVLAHNERATRLQQVIGLPEVSEGGQPQCWADHLANALSQIVSPPVLSVVMAGLCVARLSRSAAWLWAVVYVGLTVALPIAFLLWLLERGLVSDLDVQRREERIWPMLAALGGAAASLTILHLAATPHLLFGINLATFFQLLLGLAITLHWKISVHTTAAASFAVLMHTLAGAAALSLVGLILLVAWARIRLKRHTLAQTMAGALLGSLTMMIALTLGRS